MDFRVFSLVLFAAFTHALWNFASKKVSGNLQVTILGLWMANLTLLPVSLLIIAGSGLDIISVKYMSMTALAHIFYYYFLYLGYRTGDISTVYPVARGTGVAGTAVAAYFILGETFSTAGKAGISLIFAGILFIGFSRMKGRANLKTLVYSFCVGIMIILYSINDKAGVAFTNPIVYINLKDMMALVIMTPFVFRGGLPQIRETWKTKLKYSIFIGYGAIGTYLMILYAFTIERAGYISSVREFSIVFGSLMGVIFLKEKLTYKKAAGILLITAGLVFIKMS